MCLLVNHTDGTQIPAEIVCTPKAHFTAGILELNPHPHPSLQTPWRKVQGLAGPEKQVEHRYCGHNCYTGDKRAVDSVPVDLGF